MVNKLRAIFYGFVAVTLVLFVVLMYLMTTVNPPRDPSAGSATEEVTKSTDVVQTDPPESQKSMYRFPDELRTKGRRSVDSDRATKSEGLVILKVIDDESRPRLEVVLYPRWADSKWKIYRMDNILDPKVSGENLLPNSIYMSEDTLVVENDETSPNWDLNYYTTKNFRRNEMAIPFDNKKVKQVDNNLPPAQNSTIHHKRNDTEQEHIQKNTEHLSTRLTKNIEPVTSPEITTDKDTTNDMSDIIKESTEINIVLENSDNKSTMDNSLRQSVIYETVEDNTQATPAILKDISPDVKYIEDINNVTRNAVSTDPRTEEKTAIAEVTAEPIIEQSNEVIAASAEPMMEQITEETAVSCEHIIDKTAGVTASSAEPMLEQITKVTAASDEPMMEEITEVTAASDEPMMEKITEVTAVSNEPKMEEIAEVTADSNEPAKIEQITEMKSNSEESKMEQIPEMTADSQESQMEQIPEVTADSKELKQITEMTVIVSLDSETSENISEETTIE